MVGRYEFIKIDVIQTVSIVKYIEV